LVCKEFGNESRLSASGKEHRNPKKINSFEDREYAAQER